MPKMTSRDLPDLNDDVLRVILSKVEELENDDLRKLQECYNGRLVLTQVVESAQDLSIMKQVIVHTKTFYKQSSLDIFWIQDAKKLCQQYWPMAVRFSKITLRRLCEGCAKEYHCQTFTPNELKDFVKFKWTCTDGCYCEDYFSDLNWCIDCRFDFRYGLPHDSMII